MFQFLIGSLEVKSSIILVSFNHMFQFLIGSLEVASVLKARNTWHTRFNSL